MAPSSQELEPPINPGRFIIHAKLDELLRAEGHARNTLTRLDDKEPEEIEEHRDQERTVERSTP